MSLDFTADPERQTVAAPEPPSLRERGWGVIASAGLHALLLALLPLMALSRPIPLPLPPKPVEVELISAAEFPPSPAPPEAPVLAAPPTTPAAEPAETARRRRRTDRSRRRSSLPAKSSPRTSA